MADRRDGEHPVSEHLNNIELDRLGDRAAVSKNNMGDDQKNEDAPSTVNPRPLPNTRHRGEEQPGQMKRFVDFAMWAGALAFGAIMSVLSGVLGNQTRPQAKSLLQGCTAASLAAFIFSLFLMLIASFLPATIRNLRTVAEGLTWLVTASLIASVTLATIYLHHV